MLDECLAARDTAFIFSFEFYLKTRAYVRRGDATARHTLCVVIRFGSQARGEAVARVVALEVPDGSARCSFLFSFLVFFFFSFFEDAFFSSNFNFFPFLFFFSFFEAASFFFQFLK